MQTRNSDCLSPIVLFLVGLYVIPVVGGRLITMAFLTTSDSLFPHWLYFVFDIIQFFLLVVPLALLALLWRNPLYKGIYRAWLAATLFGLLFSPVQLLQGYQLQQQALLHIFLGLLYSITLLIVSRLTHRESGLRLPAGLSSLVLFAALLFAALFSYPWVILGALGSLLDTILQFSAALVIGLAAALTATTFIFPNLRRDQDSSVIHYLVGGFGIFVLLGIMTSSLGFGFGVMQLVLLFCVPFLGWAAMGIDAIVQRSLSRGSAAQVSNRRTPTLVLALLLGISTAAPMTFVDPVELALIISLSQGEILQWAGVAAAFSALIALAIGAVNLFVLRQPPESIAAGQLEPTSEVQPAPQRAQASRRRALGIGTAAAWLVALIIFLLSGRAGFHGEGLFVILKDQADLSSASNISNYNERRAFVYKTLVDKADSSQARLRKSLDAVRIAYTPYYIENGLQVQAGPLVGLWLKSQPEVDRVLENPWMRPLPEKLPISSGSLGAPTSTQWNLTEIGADKVWNELKVTGKGVVIGQSDSGVQWDHPELKNAYRGWNAATGQLNNDYNWYDPWANTAAPVDYGGHGTHTTGTIVGQHTGVAPGATWYACANLERNMGNPALYLDCMQFMLAPFPQKGDAFKDGDPSKGAMVINNSWGCPPMEGCDANTFRDAIHALASAGVFVVASAGNDGPVCVSLEDPPAIYQDAFSVGAINQQGELAQFSSIGPVVSDGSNRVKPDLVAPGENVWSSFPNNTYARESGTSMAGPHVVGVVALIWSANPALIGDIGRTTQILEQTAQPYRGSVPGCPGVNSKPSTAYGYGIVDAYAAVKMALGMK